MKHTNYLDDLKDERAERRHDKKRPRMRVHGKSLKKSGTRAILHIHKVSPPREGEIKRGSRSKKL